MVMNRRYLYSSDCMVAGALTVYDLPDLLANLAPKKVAVFRPFSHDLQPLDHASAAAALEYPLNHYRRLEAGGRLLIVEGDRPDIPSLIDWCDSG